MAGREGLSVDTEKMRLNIENMNGAIFAERAMIMLGAKLTRCRS
jgi:adenylosuccinate lyase